MEPTRRCLFVIGLPGSGKTHHALSLGPGWTLIDDPAGPDDFRADIRGDVVITSPLFCERTVLERAEGAARAAWPGVITERAFFENDPEACLRNAARRPGREVRGLVLFLSRDYDPGPGARPVWRGEE